MLCGWVQNGEFEPHHKTSFVTDIYPKLRASRLVEIMLALFANRMFPLIKITFSWCLQHQLGCLSINNWRYDQNKVSEWMSRRIREWPKWGWDCSMVRWVRRMLIEVGVYICPCVTGLILGEVSLSPLHHSSYSIEISSKPKKTQVFLRNQMNILVSNKRWSLKREPCDPMCSRISSLIILYSPHKRRTKTILQSKLKNVCYQLCI